MTNTSLYNYYSRKRRDAERVELTTKGLRNLRRFALENGHDEAAELLGELLYAVETGADHWLLADWEKRMAAREAEARRKSGERRLGSREAMPYASVEELPAYVKNEA